MYTSPVPAALKRHPPKRTAPGARAKESLIAALKEAIITGRLKPGQHLKEVELASALGVSRTPMREAFIVLEQMGLLSVNPNGRGWMVRVFSPEEVHEVLVVRSILEGAAAGLLIENLTDAKLDTLRPHLIDERHALDSGQYRQIKADGWKFHSAIVSLAGNSSLEKCFNMFRDQIRLLIIRGPASPERMWASHREHWGIVDAIEQRNPEMARLRIAAHFAAAEAALLASPNVLFDPPMDFRTLLADILEHNVRVVDGERT